MRFCDQFKPSLISFQIFHVLVIAAAFVHYHGMANMAVYRYRLYSIGEIFAHRLNIKTLFRLTKAGMCPVNETELPTVTEAEEVSI